MRDSDSTGDGGAHSPTGGAGIIETSLRHHEQAHAATSEQTRAPLLSFFDALTRKKPLDCRMDTNLNRCLNFLHLTALGVGSTLGLGLYVLAGKVASRKAGPGVIISFALAALASAFSALCYAEFAGRVPRAGSAYAYSYITVGEFVAFVIGWNMILEYVIGAASVTRGLSRYLKQLVRVASSPLVGLQLEANQTLASGVTNASLASNSTLSALNITDSHLALNSTLQQPATIGEVIVEYVARYFDWTSIALVVALALFILLGARDSTNITLSFTCVNVFVVIVIVVSSLKHLNLHNWNLDKKDVPPDAGEGGFLPFGWSGVLAGSATCFFAFIGFDTIASSAEEAKNPKRNVPASILLSLFLSFLAYMSIATVQTLLCPYYDQKDETILPEIFSNLQMPLTSWTVIVGGIAGLASSLIGGFFPLPRVLYSMAQDRLIYGSLAHVNSRLKLPVRATIVGAIFVAVLASVMDTEDLADMVSIGTLAAYSLVSLSVLILRYEDRKDQVDDSTLISNHLSFNDIVSATGSQKSAPMVLESIHEKTVQTEPIKKMPLGPKPSTPIRERGSRPLAPQLSVGFHSWFKHQSEEDLNQAEQSIAEFGHSAKSTPTRGRRLSLLSLLTSWRASDDLSLDQPDDETSSMAKVLIWLLVTLTVVFDVVLLSYVSLESNLPHEQEHFILRAIRQVTSAHPRMPLMGTGCICLVALAAVILMLSRLPASRSGRADAFQVPLVPLVPFLSILVNTFLMLNLSYVTWVRFTVWMAVGLFIYFTYGLWNSQGYLLHISS